MRINLKPEAYILEFDTETETGGTIKQFPTYRELKKSLKSLIKLSPIGKIKVYRSRRGKHIRWIEDWVLNYKGKPIMVNTDWLPN